MKKQQKKVKFGDVDLTKPHFCISWRNNLISDDYKAIVVLSIAKTVDEMRVCLLEHDISFEEPIKSILNEINYYLYELKNNDPAGYLIYHSKQALANIYSNVMFTYVDDIVKDNILYYIITRCKQLCIFNDSNANDILNKIFDYQVFKLFNYNIDLNHPSKFNHNFNELLDIINNKLQTHDNFDLNYNFTVFEFSRWIAHLDSNQFANILNYFKKIKLVKPGDILRYIEVYQQAKSEFQTSTTTG